MKVTAFIGSARKKHTYNAAEKYLKKLQSFGVEEYEIVMLSEYRIETCKGCITCFNKGEEFCPLKDDRDLLIDKIMNSDGVIFAAPNYSFQVSALMKIFLDRMGYIFHRPQFFGKTFTNIVAQGIYGGRNIVKYFNFIGNALGFNVIKGSCITTLEPMTEKAQKKIDRIIEKQSKRFYLKLQKNEYPSPSLFDLIIFRWARSSMKSMLNEDYKDFRYYKQKGWFESDYYYAIKLNWLKKLVGNFFDWMRTSIVRNK